MTTDVAEALEKVTDEQSFVAFLEVLETDWHRDESEPERPGGWEQGDIGGLLDAAAAWAAASRNAPGLPPPSPNPWRRCADIIAAGAFYE
jgi:hypothetical protein